MPSVHNISIMCVETFASMIDTYTDDHNFSVIYAQFCGDTSFVHTSYNFHDGYLFYEKRLCITFPFLKIFFMNAMNHCMWDTMEQPPLFI